MRIVMAEAGLGWLPWLVQELDHRFELLYQAKNYWDARGGIQLKTRPSELFKRQIYASFQDDPVAMSLLRFMGRTTCSGLPTIPTPQHLAPFARENRGTDGTLARASQEEAAARQRREALWLGVLTFAVSRHR